MTFTIEDVKRLVPEAKLTWGNVTGITHVQFEGLRCSVDINSPIMVALLTTRNQLAIARAALERVAESNHGSRESAIACKALDAIKQAGEGE